MKDTVHVWVLIDMSCSRSEEPKIGLDPPANMVRGKLQYGHRPRNPFGIDGEIRIYYDFYPTFNNEGGMEEA